jgi:hypothetical protein
MKGIKAVEFRIWARSFVKHKGNFKELYKIRENIRVFRQVRLDKDFRIVSQGAPWLAKLARESKKIIDVSIIQLVLFSRL